jgi:hypothetical protein
MNTRFPITTALLAGLLFSATATAGYTLSSLFGELTQDVTVITQKGTCNMNPYPKDTFSGEALNPPCASVVATCPKGKIPLTDAFSSCKALPSPNQTDITQIFAANNVIAMPQGYPTMYRYGNPADPNSVVDFNSGLSNTTGTAQCEVGLDRQFDNPIKPGNYGYTPWCFFKRTNKPLSPIISTFTNSGFQWALTDGTVLSAAQINTPSNYYCYPIEYQITTRCVTAPAAAGLNKMGIILK